MKLNIPNSTYSETSEIERNRILEQADRDNLKRGRDIEVGNGRLILQSPNGTRFSVVVSNAGAITASSI